MTELPTENVLHPRQTAELKETKARLAGMLSAPPYIRDQLADGGANVQKQIRDIDNMLKQAPEPIPPDEIDAAVKTEKLLREKWLEGMPTQAEMRRNPPGAVDKNMSWQKKTKTAVAQWKRLRRQLHASGISEHHLADEGDVSNIELYRPRGGSGEMGMDNAQIAGKDFHLPPPGAGPVVIMSDKDADVLRETNPELLAAMATLSNDQRGEVLEMVRTIAKLEEPKSDTGDSNVNVHAPLKLKRKGMSSEAKAAASERMKAVWAERKAPGPTEIGG